MNLIAKYNALFEPHPSITNEDQRRNARMFAFFTFHIVPLISFVIFIQSFFAFREYVRLPISTGLGIISICSLFYLMARTRHYLYAIYLQIFSNIVICSYILHFVVPNEVATLFAYMIGIVAGAWLLPLRQFIIATLCTLTAMFICVILHPTPYSLLGSIDVIVILTGLIYIIRLQVERLEEARHMQQINEENKHQDFIAHIFDGTSIIKDKMIHSIDPTCAQLLSIHPDVSLPASLDILPSNINTSLSLQTISLLDEQKGIRFLEIFFEDQVHAQVKLMAVRDITNQKIQQEQIFFTNKMISTGMLTASVIHEISSPLMVLQHNLDSIPLRSDFNHKAVQESVHQISSLFDSLRIFTRNKSEEESVHIIIERAIQLTKPRLKCKFAKNIPILSKSNIPSYQLLQVLINMLLNAIQSVDKKDSIHIRAEQNEKTITIVLENTGKSIPEEYQTKIFDPFFTTKKNGSGLGLAISQNILMNHGGIITLDTQYTEGCRFVVSLPAQEEVASLSLEQILLIDDEPLICELIEEALDGYSITTVSTAEEGIELLLKTAFQLVICDVSLPKKNGWEVYLTWKELPQKHAFVFLTGGAHLLPNIPEEEQKNVGILYKPFPLQKLFEMVEKHIQ